MEHKAQGVATTRGQADKVRPQLLLLFCILMNYLNLLQVIPCHIVVMSTCATQPHLVDHHRVDKHTKSTMANTTHRRNQPR